jgi:copper transport protein
VRRVLLHLTAGLLGLAVLALASPAAAHVELVFSDPASGAVLPASPERLRLDFDDAVSPTGVLVTLTGPGETRIGTTARVTGRSVTARPDRPLTRGTWVLAWQVVSYDGHPEAGLVTFSVGTVTATPTVSQARGDPVVHRLLDLVTGAGDLALLVTCGALAIGVLLPELRQPRLVAVAAAVAVVAAAVAVPLTGCYRLGRGLGAVTDPAAWSPALVGTETSAALVLAGALGAALVATRTGDRGLALLPAAVAVTVPAWSGHNRVADPAWLATFATVTHLAAAAVWLGGVVAVALSWRALGPDRVRVLRRFGTVAGLAVLVVLTEGTLLAWLTLGSWANLVGTTYGRLLLTKVALVALALAVAAANRFRGATLPRVRAEVALLLVVPLVAGVIVNESPEREEPPAPPRTLLAARTAGTTVVLGTTGALLVSAPAEPRVVVGGRAVALHRTDVSTWQGTVAPDAGVVTLDGHRLRLGPPRRTSSRPVVASDRRGAGLGGVRLPRADTPGPVTWRGPGGGAYVLRDDLAVLREVSADDPRALLPAGGYRVVVAARDALHVGRGRVPGPWRRRDAGAPTTTTRDGFVAATLGGPLARGRLALPVTFAAPDGRPLAPGAVTLRGGFLALADGPLAILSAPGGLLTGRLPQAGDGRLWLLLDLAGIPHTLVLDVTVAPRG